MRPTRQQDYEVITVKSPERIIKKQKLNSQTQYLVKWKGTEETTWELEDKLPKPLIDDYAQAIANKVDVQFLQRHLASAHKNAHCSTELLQNRQKQLTNKICNGYAQKTDEIQSIALRITDDQCVFEVKWSSRPDGIEPLREFYQYDQFKLVAPLLFIKYMESVLLNVPTEGQIKYIGPGETRLERALALKKALLRSNGYQDTQYDNMPSGQMKQRQDEERKNNIIQEFSCERSENEIINELNGFGNKCNGHMNGHNENEEGEIHDNETPEDGIQINE